MTLYYYDGVDPHWTSRHPFLDENYSNDKGIPTLVNR